MPGVLQTPSQQAYTKQVLPSVTLAFWQLRQIRGFLLVAGLGIIVAITLVCGVTLYAQVAMSVDLRETLTSSSQNVDINVQSFSEYPNSDYYAQVSQVLDAEFQQQLGSYLQHPQFVVDVSGLIVPRYGKMNILGFSVDQIGSHLQLTQGRLPHAQSHGLEIALTQETASSLHVHLGSMISTSFPFGTEPLAVTLPLKMLVVGIFNSPSPSDAFWHGNTFQSVSGLDGTTYTALVSNKTLLTAINQLGTTPIASQHLLYAPLVLHWYFQLNPTHITINNLDTLLKHIRTAETYVNSNGFSLERTPFLEQIAVLYNDSLQQYADRIAIMQLSLFSLVILMVGLVLFFLSMIAELLVERQAETLALLRSRGASFSQILGLLLSQSIVLTGIALVVGILLTFAVVSLLVLSILRLNSSQAFELIVSNSRQSSVVLIGSVLLTALVVILFMSISMYHLARTTLTSYRRETSRSTRRPLWQHFYLDVVASLVALTGYLVRWYVMQSPALNVHLRLLLLTPITLFSCVFLLIAALLLLTRILPLLLSLGERRATHSQSIAPLLALAQHARTPYRFLRTILLLTIAIAFVLFSLIFSTSQQQHIVDTSAYQVEADFHGTPISSTLPASEAASETAFYQHVPGVLSTSVGYIGTATAIYYQTVNIQLRAVDADTFAQTALWPGQSASSLSSLMNQLASRRTSAVTQRVIPAIIDIGTATALHISQGKHFTLTFASDGPIQFFALAEVPAIATISEQGILVDYQSFAAVYANTTQFTSGNTIPINTIWLHTKSDVRSLKHVRHALTETFTSFVDRRVLQANLEKEPLNLALLTVLRFGTALTLLFALLGTLLSSWLSIQNRLRSFVVLRALGATSRQFMSVIAWEQSLVYVVSLLLGSVCGLLFSMQAVPRLVFTTVLPDVSINTLSSDDFYVLQNTPPIRLIIPPSVGLVIATLTIICTCILGLMIATVARSAMSEALRINED